MLNASQREAVRYLNGPCLVLAGAGSGKTRVIAHKIAFLIREADFAPAAIAAITFTNKAAREMAERVAGLLGRNPSGLVVATFHALGLQILRTEHERAGLKAGFSVLDDGDRERLLAEVVRDGERERVRQLRAQISAWKNRGVGVEAAEVEAEGEAMVFAAAVYREYERLRRAYHAVDFDDLLWLPVQLLRRDEEVCQRWQRRWRYLLVDEYQDTNRVQYELLRLLTGVRGMFTAVGDDDQAIYAWRGADSDNLRALMADFPTLRVIKLEENYRSPETILAAANALIAHNEKLFTKVLRAQRPGGERVRVVPCRDPEAEAEWVAATIDARRFASGGRWRDFAVLYRSNHQARVLEQALRSRQIPYVVSGGTSYFERAEIRDAMAYLRLLVNEDDDPAFMRAVATPRRGVGSASLAALSRYAGERRLSMFAALFETGAEVHVAPGPLAALREFAAFINHFRYRAEREPAGRVAHELIAASGLEAFYYETLPQREAERRSRSLRDLIEWIGRRGEREGERLLEVVQVLSVVARLEREEDGRADAVQLATLHAAKGLEFRHVFLVGVEEGLLPHETSVAEGRIEEERRLMYVGVTRAIESLTICYCEQRRGEKGIQQREPSRFIAEMGAEVEVYGRERTPTATERAAYLATMRALLERAPIATI
ncbi:MAG: UvrD-helicase domain-containing protein [Hydrogenophilus sp.]|nr:UvrD-helicase domain-containing protein [Hydrogenophilus sp.]